MVEKEKESLDFQTALRLSAGLHERLKQSPKGISADIRDRLERSFAHDDLDQGLRDLLDAITQLHSDVEWEIGLNWHQSLLAYRAFVAAIELHLESLRPWTTFNYPDDEKVVNDEDEAKVLGRIIARRLERRLKRKQKST